MVNKKYFKIIGLVLLFAAGLIGGYFYFSMRLPLKTSPVEEIKGKGITVFEDFFTIRVYYPFGGRLQMEERRIQARATQMVIAEAVIGEFLKGPVNEKVSEIPKDTKLLGIYKGDDNILYIDLSDEFRRNFKGDIIAEFLLLKGLFESLISNVPDITDVKILIEGMEMESLGGHIYLLYPLKETVGADSSV